ncbi:AP-4 complex subunit epsilon [Olea europaea subsp. europaea]|uniref:AP-4 complex subunit epsilon n=1 Tax=Olea europaea subsp. europaea TaxID=158383 RepID=A0A8S0RGV7_OLEEU|nr:AP-4 complex subunit epsilon [Olea europaea subsp. europaea]
MGTITNHHASDSTSTSSKCSYTLSVSSQRGFGHSKELLNLIKSIGKTRSKEEEDRIVLREIYTLETRLSSPNTPKYKLKEYLMRLIYVEMLGHDASFGYIHAVKMTHDESLLLKRTGYLVMILFLNEDHKRNGGGPLGASERSDEEEGSDGAPQVLSDGARVGLPSDFQFP